MARKQSSSKASTLASKVLSGAKKPTAKEAKCPSGDFMSRMNRLSGAPS